jgi:hypothetical protein
MLQGAFCRAEANGLLYANPRFEVGASSLLIVAAVVFYFDT